MDVSRVSEHLVGREKPERRSADSDGNVHRPGIRSDEQVGMFHQRGGFDEAEIAGIDHIRARRGLNETRRNRDVR